MWFAMAGSIMVALILILGTVWSGHAARNNTEDAVHSVSLLYLDELAGRREQVVEDNLKDNIDVINIAIDLMTENDLSDIGHLQDYQARMKRLFNLERFAFVDSNGLIYTALGTQNDIDQYEFDYHTISVPEISIKNIESPEKKVVIAVPVDHIPFNGEELVVCYMEIDMNVMLQGVSMTSQNSDATFCNIYTSDGIALSNTVLGGLAEEDNLLEAMEHAEFENGGSLQKMQSDFEGGRGGAVSFTYNGISETLSYVPVSGTDWFLTYLIRESVISDQIGSVSDGIIQRSLILSVLITLVLLVMFAAIIFQTRKSGRIALEKERSETENRVKQEELEQRLALQEQLLEQERERQQRDKLITAMGSDYRSLYYIDLDQNEGVCYQAIEGIDNMLNPGERFIFSDELERYADEAVTDKYREDFLSFLSTESIRSELEHDRVSSFLYTVSRNGTELYERVRVAGVRRPEDRDDHIVHAIGLGFTEVDAETRKQLAQGEALENALSAAEEANRAKTSFLSNMSHEIRTPMNAIIGLDNIALADTSISDSTRDYLEKIGTSAHHLLSIINDILDMSRIESGRMTVKNEEFSFSKTLAQVNTIINGQCNDKGLHYDCKIKGDVQDYYIGDDMKLRQVMVNILGNAVKFTPEGGNVSLLIETVARYDGKSTLRFTFTDTGIGMSEEYLPRLFEAFTQEDSSTTNRYGSTGLGMPITKNIVELMNGNIEVESTKGKGTIFTVTLTLIDSDRRKDNDDQDELPQDMCVLVIDDDFTACDHAQLILGQVGISCEKALSGDEGLEMVKLRHARREPYNLILIDWKMPGMDGVETTRKIREIVGNGTPVIILTSYNWDDIIDEAHDAGVDSFVAKPLFAGNVLDEFREAFRLKNSRLVKETANLEGKRVLLAEDVEVNAEIMMMVLSMREMIVEHAANGRIAVDMFSQSAPGYYDAILMDMRMPEMDGLEATRTIRAMNRPDAGTIPIIALTANAFDEDVQRSMQAGLNAHLSKPVEPEALFSTLEGLIE